MKDPIGHSKDPRTLITNESPSPSAVWVGIIDHLCALHEQFCKMAVGWTQIVVIRGKVLCPLHYITVAAVITWTRNARKLVSIRPFHSPLRPWVSCVHIPPLSSSSVLGERESAQGTLHHPKLRPTYVCASIAPESGLASLFTYAFHYFLASSKSRASGEYRTSFFGLGDSLPAMFEMVRVRLH